MTGLTEDKWRDLTAERLDRMEALLRLSRKQQWAVASTAHAQLTSLLKESAEALISAGRRALERP